MSFSAAYFSGTSLRWPLLGDSAQIHYICFLLDHGMAPYRVAGDMNMPGALLEEWLVMHTLGPGSLAWRLFDLGLCGAGCAAMAVIAGKRYRSVGIAAGLLFLLLHGADGLNDTGERDLSIAVFLLLAYAALFALLRLPRTARPGSRGSLLLSFGLALGSAASIKPTVFLLTAALLAVLADRLRGEGRVREVGLTALGFFLPLLACVALLLKEQALGAFVHGLRTAVPYYASLEHRSLAYLLPHSIAPLGVAFLCWLLGPAWMRPMTLERKLLGLGVLFGLFSYVAQAKGFPYYRYPLLAFLLPWMALDCAAVWQQGPSDRRGGAVRALALVALVYGASLAPVSAWKAHRFHWWDQQFLLSLGRDLTTLGAQNGQVQCIDSISGCGNTLLRLHLVQSTGLLSDFFVFGDPHAPAVRDARTSFQAAVAGALPTYVVVTDHLHLHPEDPGGWHKLATWPWFEAWLAAHYTAVLERYPTRSALWWARPEMPGAYRIYVLHAAAPDASAALSGQAGTAGRVSLLRLPEP